MQPLRQVETLPWGDFSRSSEKQLAPPEHWTIPSDEATHSYLDFLDSLSPVERETFVVTRFSAGATAGGLARQRGYEDVTSSAIGLCGSPEPLIFYSSNRMNAEVTGLEEKWRELATARKVASGQKIYRWLDDYEAIEQGFQRLVAEVIYGDYGNDWLTEAADPHIRDLMLDPPALRELVTIWLGERTSRDITVPANEAEPLHNQISTRKKWLGKLASRFGF